MGKLFDKALALHRAGNLLEAERLYQGIYRRDHNDAAAALNLGVVRLSLGRNQDALKPLRRAVLLDPGAVEPYRALAETLDRLGQVTEAITAHRRIASLRPDDPLVHVALGAVLLADRDADGALVAFDRAAALGGAPAQAHGNAGLALKMLGRFDDAAVRFAKAVQMAPTDVAAPYNWGKMLNERGDAATAERLFRRTMDLSPNFAEAKLALADVYREAARTEEALALLDAILVGIPDHPVASVWRCVFQLPVLYRDENEISVRRANYSRQLEALARQVASDPRAAICPALRQRVRSFSLIRGRTTGIYRLDTAVWSGPPFPPSLRIGRSKQRPVTEYALASSADTSASTRSGRRKHAVGWSGSTLRISRSFATTWPIIPTRRQEMRGFTPRGSFRGRRHSKSGRSSSAMTRATFFFILR